jgi:hypothetical protein
LREYIKTILNGIAACIENGNTSDTGVPSPTANDVGAFLRVSDNGKLIYELLTDVSEEGS